MKICHIITGLGFGGAERLLVNFSNIHSECGHQVYVLYLKDITSLKDALHPSVETIHVPLNNKTSSRIRKLLGEIKPDVVHTHLGHADLLGLWAARGLDLKLFCTMHNIWFKWNWKDKIIFKAYKFLFRTVARKCKVIAISNVVKKHVVETLKVPSNRVHLLYNGIPSALPNCQNNSLDLRRALKISTKNFNVLFVGRLEPQKSVDTLLKAVSLLKDKIPSIKLLLVGEGSLRAELERLALELGLKDIVEFRGVTLKPEEYFAVCDLFVLPSIFEGMGIVLLEAFRASLPVIASNTEGPGELITHGQTGLLFEPLQHKELANLMYKFYLSPSLLKEIGENGNKFYKENFKIEDYAAKLEELYVRS
ncbi:glycosyltransferase involved in cell wall biosynthesis [Pontibacter ummariensis]|uniref:Glycosyltransferase involved in cell wall bisynthesis n=1 Tax=Pontibacter ummariensis TaxID=1610492 RepID=A0A239FDL2_9BACT|nr:glycosyltransferase family 4 protein [Pontibacter ummariensis]PRY12309.1 glycosyltransferase involved in cell wall biosynthesis [Pontibacter ummariensis]SNS54841.1 Glycosyltransferase involved in cell wall bisynthesis [Pontibacter ummariensis]